MKKFFLKAFSWLMGALAGLTAVLIIILLVSIVSGGFSESMAHIKNQMFVRTNGGNRDDSGEFLSNRDFEKMNTVVTPMSKVTVLGEGVIDFCEISIEGLYPANCFAEKADIYGPFGVMMSFNKGIPCGDHPEVSWETVTEGSAEYIRVYSVEERDGEKYYSIVDLSKSYIYFESVNEDGSYSVISTVSGDTWLQLEEYDWNISFKEKDGTLMVKSGRYRVVLVMDNKEISVGENETEIVTDKKTVQIYDLFANNGVYHYGIMQKKGEQDDYRFQLNFCGKEHALIYPESQKLSVSEGQLFGVACSPKNAAQNAVITLYYFDTLKNEYIKTDEKVLFDNNSETQKQMVSLDFGGHGSGTYKIVLEGEFRKGLFGREKITEEYEYYYSIGDLS